jgi:hypothetical protein
VSVTLSRVERRARKARELRAGAAVSAFVVLLLAVVAGAQEPLRLDADAPRSGQTPDGSVDRVRAALEKPPSKLTLQDRTPDFSVHIEKRRPMQDIFDIPPWQLEPRGWQPPGVGFDLLSVVRYVAKGVSDAKRAHDERAAHDEVLNAIADYCAGLPDRAHVQICPSR